MEKTLTTVSSHEGFIGEPVHINLPSNPSTGFGWYVDPYRNDSLKLVDEKFNRHDPYLGVVGGGGTHTFTFVPTESGVHKLKFHYKRIWEGKAPAKTHEVDIHVI